MIVGLIRPSEGKIFLDNEDITITARLYAGHGKV